MLVPVWRDRTQKPPMGVPLRSDGHWSVQGLVGAWAFNEGAGTLLSTSGSHSGIWDPAGLDLSVAGRKATLPSSCVKSSGTIIFGFSGIGTPIETGKLFITTDSEFQLYRASFDTQLIFTIGGVESFHGVPDLWGTGAHIIAASWSTKPSREIYVDKKLCNTFTYATTVPTLSSTLYVGDRSDDLHNAGGIYSFFFVFSYALTPAQIASLSANPWQIYEPEITFIETVPKIFQSYYRFRNDDGSETSATWMEGENTVITKPADSNIRLRLSLESQGNPSAKNLQLEYRRIGNIDDYVPIKVDRTQKPPMGVPLRSDGHWSVQGLVRAWAFNEGAGLAFSDSVSGSRLISTTPVAMADGICVSGTQSLGTYDVRNIPSTPPFTVIADIDMVENKASSAICGIGGLRWSFKYDQYCETGRLGFTIGGLADYVSNLSSPKGRSAVSAVVSSDSILFNGLDLISATISLSNQPTIIHVGSNDTDVDYAKGAVYGLLLYSRALPTPQIASLSANPWQIYEPETIWVPRNKWHKVTTL